MTLSNLPTNPEIKKEKKNQNLQDRKVKFEDRQLIDRSCFSLYTNSPEEPKRIYERTCSYGLVPFIVVGNHIYN